MPKLLIPAGLPGWRLGQTPGQTSGQTPGQTSPTTAGLLHAGLGLCLLLLTACSRLTTVQNVHEHPQRNWLTQTVQLQGTVGSRAPLLQGQIYELQDETGKIWVLSPKANLQTGTSILIQGQVRYESIEIEGQNLGEAYIEEQQQLPPSP
ncbi:MAG: hypothetical protein ACKO7W_11990 [Elainella sp.]